MRKPRVAEFFAGIGLMRRGLEAEGFSVAFANDIDAVKHRMYRANFGDAEFVLGDIREIHGRQLDDIQLATASFPCTDLSLAGKRAGLGGRESSMFWEFARVVREMGRRRPPVVMLENVPSFASSHGGKDFANAMAALGDLGYWCDIFVLDARSFVPQSRQRLFVVGSRRRLFDAAPIVSESRPKWLAQLSKRDALKLHFMPLPGLPTTRRTLSSIVERLSDRDERWWDKDRVRSFVDCLSPLNDQRLTQLIRADRKSFVTAYRRTRRQRPVWEIRSDGISGCLRTARGGSSRQAVVEAGRNRLRIRWMTVREYARLQGAHNYQLDDVSESQGVFGFGDAVCVPVVSWIARSVLAPVLRANGVDVLMLDSRLRNG